MTEAVTAEPTTVEEWQAKAAEIEARVNIQLDELGVRIREMTDRANAVTQERDTLALRVRTLEAQARVHDQWKEALVRDAHEEADSRGWCDSFDDFMENHDLPRRSRDYEVEVTYKVTVKRTVRASSDDAAREEIEEDSDFDANDLRSLMDRYTDIEFDEVNGVETA